MQRKLHLLVAALALTLCGTAYADGISVDWTSSVGLTYTSYGNASGTYIGYTGYNSTNAVEYYIDSSTGWTCAEYPISQTVSGLDAGSYTVSFYATANLANWSGGTHGYTDTSASVSTAAVVYALGEGDTVTAVLPTWYSTGLTSDEPYEYSLDVTVGEEGTLSFGIHILETSLYVNWCTAQIISLVQTISEEEADSIYQTFVETAKELVENAYLASSIAETLQECIDATDITDYETAIAAIQTAIASAEASIAQNQTLAEGGSVDAGSAVTGWATTNNQTLQYNTWSTETDNYGVTNPFIENWVASGSTLDGSTKTYYTAEGLLAGLYTVTGIIRILNEAGTSSITGATFFVNDSIEDLTETGIEISNFNGGSIYALYDSINTQVSLSEDGDLVFGLNIGEDANYNWVAFKDFAITLDSLYTAEDDTEEEEEEEEEESATLYTLLNKGSGYYLGIDPEPETAGVNDIVFASEPTAWYIIENDEDGTVQLQSESGEYICHYGGDTWTMGTTYNSSAATYTNPGIESFTLTETIVDDITYYQLASTLIDGRIVGTSETTEGAILYDDKYYSKIEDLGLWLIQAVTTEEEEEEEEEETELSYTITSITFAEGDSIEQLSNETAYQFDIQPADSVGYAFIKIGTTAGGADTQSRTTLSYNEETSYFEYTPYYSIDLTEEVYYVTVVAYASEDDYNYDNDPLVSDTITIYGTAEASTVSSVSLTSLYPTNGSEIETDDDLTVMLAFDGKVNINSETSFLNYGRGITYAFASITADSPTTGEDGLEYSDYWTLVVDQEYFEVFEGDLTLTVVAIDEEGNRVYNESLSAIDDPDYTYFLIEYTYDTSGSEYLSIDDLTITSSDSIVTISSNDGSSLGLGSGSAKLYDADGNLVQSGLDPVSNFDWDTWTGGDTYTYTLEGLTDGTYTLVIPAGAITDSEGNGYEEITVTVTISAATGISSINAGSASFDATNIYSLSGQLIRTQATSLEGLQQGIYIVGGKKVLVK